MASLRRWKLEERAVARQKGMFDELDALVSTIERCEKTIIQLKDDLEATNEKHSGRRTTADDVAYLTDLLDCAKKKLRWEKQMQALSKRTPALLQRITALMNDPKVPPSQETRDRLVKALECVQGAMERLERAKLD